MKITDREGDTIEVGEWCSMISVLTEEKSVTTRVHLTRKQSKMLRKMLKAAEAGIK